MLVTHLFLASSDYLDPDVVFGVKGALITTLGRVDRDATRPGVVISAATTLLQHDFLIAPSATQGH